MQTSCIHSSDDPERLVEAVWQPGRIDALWPAAAPLIEQALDAEVTLAEVYNALLAHRSQLWAGWCDGELEFVLVTEVRHYVAHSVAYLCIAAGKSAADWGKYLPELEKWARAIGCDILRLHGRRGWLRVLEGFKEKTVVLEKQL